MQHPTHTQLRFPDCERPNRDDDPDGPPALLDESDDEPADAGSDDKLDDFDNHRRRKRARKESQHPCPPLQRLQTPVTALLQLSAASLEILLMLAFFDVPSVIIKLMLSVCRLGSLEVDCLDHLEFFAGKKAVTRALLREGFRAVGCELKDADGYAGLDFISPMGVITNLWFIHGMRLGARMLAAPVCSSWVWMSRATTKRAWHRVHGLASLPCVQTGNMIVSVLVMILWIASALGIRWCVEQPANSLLQHHPRWQEFLRGHRCFRVFIYMSDFGGETAKPTWLYSNAKDIEEIVKFRCKITRGKVNHNKEMTHVSTSATGRKQITGGSDLKGSQAYPDGFGYAWFSVCAAHRLSNREEEINRRQAVLQSPAVLHKLLSDLSCSDTDNWADANVSAAARRTESENQIFAKVRLMCGTQKFRKRRLAAS